MSSPTPIVEIGSHRLFLLDGAEGLELDLERDAQLRLTQPCLTRVAAALGDWARSHGWERGREVWFALGGRGVSLRQLKLPGTGIDNLESVLSLQIEGEFPVPPSELAWGFMTLGRATPTELTQVLVGALKPEALKDLIELCDAAGLEPRFTLASLARWSLCPSPPSSFSILHVEAQQSELICFQAGTPESVRLLPWGTTHLNQVLTTEARVTADEALREWGSAGTSADRRDQLQKAFQKALLPLQQALSSADLGQAIYCSGPLPTQPGVDKLLLPAAAAAVRIERLAAAPGLGSTSATQGIRAWHTRFPGIDLLQLHSRGSHTPLPVRQPAPLKWGLVAACLLLGLLSLRYVEPLLGKPRLARRLAEVEKQKALLPKLEQELAFLQYLQRNQPPFLEAVATLAQSASPGLRLDSLNMNRKGEVSLRGLLANASQAVDLRLKLIESGFFSSVVVEEQTPTPDRNQLIVRMSAQWKTPEERLAASLKTPQMPPPASAERPTMSSPSPKPDPTGATNHAPTAPAAAASGATPPSTSSSNAGPKP